MTIIKLLTSFTIILSLTSSEQRLVGVEAGCFGSDKDLNPQILRSHRAQVDPRLMSDAYQVIDKKLQSKVRDNDVDKNMKVVMRLLRVEINSESLSCFNFFTKPLISEDYRNVTINALLRLNDLKKVKKSGLACSMVNTQHLVENNIIARDSIGRRLMNEPNLLPRIDNLIFDIAQQRAEHCLPKYKELLTNILDLDSTRIIGRYWDPIFKHKLTKGNFDDDVQVDIVFKNSPEQALSFLDGMQYAIEEDEMDIILKHLSESSAKSSFKFPYDGSDPNIHKFEKFARIPCANFIDTTSNLFQSLDFDIRLKPYLSTGSVGLVDKDHVVYRLKAYRTMCKKLIEEKDRFSELLNRHLINSLPYKSEEYD